MIDIMRYIFGYSLRTFWRWGDFCVMECLRDSPLLLLRMRFIVHMARPVASVWTHLNLSFISVDLEFLPVSLM